MGVKKKIKLIILKLSLQKEKLHLRYLELVHNLFYKHQKIFIDFVFSKLFDYVLFKVSYAKFGVNTYIFNYSEKDFIPLKEILKIGRLAFTCVVVALSQGILNFLFIILLILNDFFVNFIGVYKNTFLRKFAVGFMKVFFIGTFWYFLPLSYGLMLLL